MQLVTFFFLKKKKILIDSFFEYSRYKLKLKFDGFNKIFLKNLEKLKLSKILKIYSLK